MASVDDRRMTVRDGKKVATGYKGTKPWRARWRETPGGPQKTQHFATKKAAEQHLVAVQHSLLQGTYVAPKDASVTLRSYVEVYVGRQHWRAGTESTARASLAHALAVLGDRPLNAIRRGDVQSLLAGIDRAPGTVRLVRQHLGGVLQSAVDDGLLVRNPAKGVRGPSDKAGEVVPPTSEQVAALYDAAPEWFRPAIVLGAGLGLREAETAGLTLDRVQWLARSVRVDRQWQTKRRPFGFAPPKSAASDRTIPAGETVLNELSLLARSEGFAVSPNGGESAMVYSRFWSTWTATTKRAGVEGMKYHALRHYYASALISAGCSVKAVQKALGHGSASITLDTYGHLWPGDEDRMRSAVDAALRAEDWLRTEDPGSSVGEAGASE